jgi:hypothetical protein
MSGMTGAYVSLAEAATKMGGRRLGRAAWELAVLSLIVLGALLAIGVAAYFIRKRALEDEKGKPEVPLTLADVRRMHESGEIDDAEMNRLKGIVAQRTRNALLEKPTEPKE